MDIQYEKLLAFIDDAKKAKQKLVIVTGNPGSGKTQILREVATKKRWDYIDCRTLVSDELIELLPAMRAAKAPAIMGDILENYDSEVLILDRVQTFFTPVLQLNPMTLLRELSEKYTLVVAWPGFYKDGTLNFTRMGESDPLTFDASDIKIWSVESMQEHE